MCYYENAFGVWPSGKAVGSEPSMLWFESRYPSHEKITLILSVFFVFKSTNRLNNKNRKINFKQFVS